MGYKMANDELMTIGQVAERLKKSGLGLSPGTIRKYCDLGLLSPARRPAGEYSRRVFDEQAFTRVKLVVILKKLGLRNQEIVNWMEAPDVATLSQGIRGLTPLVAEARILVGLLRESLKAQDVGQVESPRQAA